MTTMTRHVRAGQPFVEAAYLNDFSEGRWQDLEPVTVDDRVSYGEQQDHQAPIGEPAAWQLIGLTLSPLLVIGLVSLFFLLRANH
jgi:hypothetical protein